MWHGNVDAAELASVGQTLQHHAAAASQNSEKRDKLREGERVEEDLESRSEASSHARSASSGVGQPDVAQEDDKFAKASDAGSVSASSASIRFGDMSGGDVPRRRNVHDLNRAGIQHILDKSLEAKVNAVISGARRVVQARRGTPKSGMSSVSGSSPSTVSSAPPAAHTESTSVGAGSRVLSEPATVLAPLAPALAAALGAERRAEVDRVVGKVVEKTVTELVAVEETLREVKDRELAILQEKVELDVKVSVLSSEAAVAEEALGELKQTKDKIVKVEDERDELHDKLIGLSKQREAWEQRLGKERENIKKEHELREEELILKSQRDMAELKEALAIAAKELAEAKQMQMQVSSERDMLHRSQEILQKTHEAEIAAFVAQLNAAESEIDRRNKALQRSGLSVEAADEWKMQLEFEQTLKEQSAMNRRVSNDLAALRIEMLQSHQAKDKELSELKAKVEVTSAIPMVQPVKNKQGPHRYGVKAPQLKLSRIDEEEHDEDAISQAGSAISGQVSSFGDEVGNLRDFDDYVVASTPGTEADRIKDLESRNALLCEKLADLDSAYKRHIDETTAKEAEQHAKAARLFRQMQDFRKEAAEKDIEVLRLKKVSAGGSHERHEELVDLKRKVAIMEAHANSADARDEREKDLESLVSALANEVEELRQQLSLALESKRLLNVRVEDMAHEMKSMESRHAQTVEDFHTQLKIANQSTDQQGSTRAANDLLVRLHAAEEQRNVLQNALDCERVHWEAKIESETLQHAVVRDRLKREESERMKAKTYGDQQESELKDTRRALAASRSALQEAEAKLQAKEELAASAMSVVAASFLDMLRCPTRNTTTPSRNLAGESVPIQAMVWEVISSMQGVSALMCSHDSLEIMDASKKAFSVWGSAALRGQSLLSLVFDSHTCSWLRAELEGAVSQSLMGPMSVSIPGFWVRVLTYVELRTRLGSALECTLTCFRLPQETARPPVIMAIVEPVAEASPQQTKAVTPQHHQLGGCSWGRSRGPGSSISSVASDDITANDSVSNVNGHR